MVNSLKVSMNQEETDERFVFVLRALESELEYSARLSRGGGALAQHDNGSLSTDDLGLLLERMNETTEGDAGERCTIEVKTVEDEVHTTADFPVKRLLEDTIVGRVYDRLRSAFESRE